MTGAKTIVRVTHRYAAPPGRVFDAWTDPELVRRWFLGLTPHDESMVSATVDPRPGGTFSFVVRRQGQDLDHHGVYLEFDRPRRLVFTWGVGRDETPTSVVTVDVVPAGEGAELTLTHELHPDWAAYAAQTETGWRRITAAVESALGPRQTVPPPAAR